MKDQNPLPESARRAFESYPELMPSSAFNRAVLHALAEEQARRKQTFIGRIEEFLGVGLWQFAASGALGAFLPAAILGCLMLSGNGAPPKHTTPNDFPLAWRGMSPFYSLRREELTI